MPIAIPGNAKNRSASRRNGDRHQPGIVIGIIAESRSSSARNADRHRPEYALSANLPPAPDLPEALTTDKDETIHTLRNDLADLEEHLSDRDNTIARLQRKLDRADSSCERKDSIIAIQESTITSLQRINELNQTTITRRDRVALSFPLITWSKPWLMLLLAFVLGFVLVTPFYLGHRLENKLRSVHLPPPSSSGAISAKGLYDSLRAQPSPAPVPEFLQTPSSPIQPKSVRPPATARTPSPLPSPGPQYRIYRVAPRRLPPVPVPPEVRLEDQRTLPLPPNSTTPMPNRFHRSAPPPAKLEKERFL